MATTTTSFRKTTLSHAQKTVLAMSRAQLLDECFLVRVHRVPLVRSVGSAALGQAADVLRLPEVLRRVLEDRDQARHGGDRRVPAGVDVLPEVVGRQLLEHEGPA